MHINFCSIVQFQRRKKAEGNIELYLLVDCGTRIDEAECNEKREGNFMSLSYLLTNF